MGLFPTSSQTVGPFFSIGLERLCGDDIAGAEVDGERIVVEGAVLDGDGMPVPDALLEIWQADSQGNYASGGADEGSGVSRGFRGFGRVATDDQGRFRFATIRPGGVKDAEGREQSPHIVVSVFMRGLLTRLVTRIYFADDSRNAEDGVLLLVPADRRGTLTARASGGRAGVFEWNVVLQGPNETVFFSC